MPFFDPIRIGASGTTGDFEVERSLRFNRADTTYLERTPSSDGNKRTWTFSAWIKRGQLTSLQTFFSAGSNNPDVIVKFTPSNQFEISRYGGSYQTQVTSTQLFRDPSAWYHLVGAVDTTQSTASDRVKMYVNGVQITSFANSNYPSQNYEYPEINNTSYSNKIGKHGSNSQNFDGYIAEFNFIDGLQLTPSSFGETNADTGQWVPIDTSGLTFGTNGFRLKYADNSATSATTLGKDSSGNGNNFTPFNFSVAAGQGNDSVSDSPTNNFCTINPLVGRGGNYLTYTNGNLDFTISPASTYPKPASSFQIPTSGKWYCEWVFTTVATGVVGVGNVNTAENGGSDQLNGINYLYTGEIRINDSTSQGSLTALSDNDIVGVKVDSDAGTVAFTINGSAAGNAENISSMATPTDLVFWAYRNAGGGTDPVGFVNFGQKPFSYQPSGFKALNSQNLPDPTILLPNEHFNTLLWSGNGAASRSITGLDFQPDWVWLKSRTNTDYHQTHDSVRGIPAGVLFIESAVEDANYPLDSFDSDGFTTSADASDQQNTNGQNYVAWNWNAGNTDGKTYTVTVVSDSGNKYRFDGFGTSAVTLDLAEGGTYIFNYPAAHPFRFSTTADGTHGGGTEYTTGVTVLSSTSIQIVVAASAPNLNYYCSSHSGMGGAINTNSSLGSSNFDGTLQATVKANQTAGFSIGLFTAQTSGSATVGHGLGVAPDVVITKSRTLNGTSWFVYHQYIGENGWILFESDGAATTGNSAVNNPAPTSSVFTYGSGLVNHLSNVFYAFSEISGFSKFGSYVGNGNSDGVFVFTNFRPAVIILKRTNAAAAWVIHDNKRAGYNADNDYLHPDNAQSESDGSSGTLDILSNGFKLRMTAGTHNGSGDTFIYLCFAESPFKNARAR